MQHTGACACASQGEERDEEETYIAVTFLLLNVYGDMNVQKAPACSPGCSAASCFPGSVF